MVGGRSSVLSSFVDSSICMIVCFSFRRMFLYWSVCTLCPVFVKYKLYMSVSVVCSSIISPGPLSADTIVSPFVFRSRLRVVSNVLYFVYVRVCRCVIWKCVSGGVVSL